MNRTTLKRVMESGPNNNINRKLSNHHSNNNKKDTTNNKLTNKLNNQLLQSLHNPSKELNSQLNSHKIFNNNLSNKQKILNNNQTNNHKIYRINLHNNREKTFNKCSQWLSSNLKNSSQKLKDGLNPNKTYSKYFWFSSQLHSYLSLPSLKSTDGLIKETN